MTKLVSLFLALSAFSAFGQSDKPQKPPEKPIPQKSKFEAAIDRIDHKSSKAYRDSVVRGIGEARKEAKSKKELDKLKEVVTKYRLLMEPGDPDVEGEGYPVKVVRPEHIKVVKVTIEEVSIGLVPVEVNTVYVVDVGGVSIPILSLDYVPVVVQDPLVTEVPVNAVVQLTVDTSVLAAVWEWKAVYYTAFAVMGRKGLYKPHPNSPLGYIRVDLERKLRAAGPEWRNNPELVTLWEEYWVKVKAALDRRGPAGGRSRR